VSLHLGPVTNTVHYAYKLEELIVTQRDVSLSI